MTDQTTFPEDFRLLTGHLAFPWQLMLYHRFLVGDVPESCSLPTGMGKTSIIAIWLLALAAEKQKIPRRLVYVVNRRTVVDQTTDEVEKLLDNLRQAGLWEPLKKLCGIPLAADQPPLAISTLRGQFADNQEWSADPSRPAVICGTVDMIGSRLLFEGYGIGFKSRPLHAGFLGQDALLVHDEAHLEPAFQKLIETIEKEQQKERNRAGELPWPKLRVMALSATNRDKDEASDDETETPFELTEEERNPPAVLPDTSEAIHYVWKRLSAKKSLNLHPCEDEKKNLAKQIAELALKHAGSGAAVLVFVRRVDDVNGVALELQSKKTGNVPEDRIETLTGTMRGYERDRMADPRREDASRVFARFLPRPNVNADENEKWKTEPIEGTVYLICTSAGEVGVNISADHMVSDLSTFESMAQRLGRVNRFGDREDTQVDVVCPETFGEKGTHEELERRRKRTLALLRQLDGDASPFALDQLDPQLRSSAFAPMPKMLEATDILFDAWAMTSIRGKMPGRPPVEPYLHGIAEWEPPRTSVAWREEVEVIADELIESQEFLQTLLDDYPLKPHELLKDRSERVYDALQDIEKRFQKDKKTTQIWIVNPQGGVERTSLKKLLKNDKKRVVAQIEDTTILLPPSTGGLTRQGTLDGKIGHDAAHPSGYDVADKWYRDKEKTAPRRCRVWDDVQPPPGMALIRTIDTDPHAGEFDQTFFEVDEEPHSQKPRFWNWYALPLTADDATRASKAAVTWDDHTNDVVQNLKGIVKALNLPEEMQEALILTAEWHDLGKKREDWQRWIGNPVPTDWHAKSARPGTKYRGDEEKRWLRGIRYEYRHEFGSLLDVLDAGQEYRTQFNALPVEMQDIVLHMIAAHHGGARPHFPPNATIDPAPPSVDAEAEAIEAIRRYARLQRRYGRWGLAYLESLLRAADWHASANPTNQGADS